MQMITNTHRAGWALEALTEFVASTRIDTAEDAIADLIADLLHLARGRGFDEHDLVQRAVELMADKAEADCGDGMAAVQTRFRNLLPDDGAGFTITSR
jgi:predicted Ser/Thr protein kinase